MLSGDNGLLKRAGDARDDTVVGQEKEQVELAYISAAVKKLGDNVDKDDLQDELDISVGDGKTTVSGSITLKVKFEDTKHEYTVSQNGVVSKYEKTQLTDVYATVCANGVLVFSNNETDINSYLTNNSTTFYTGWGIEDITNDYYSECDEPYNLPKWSGYDEYTDDYSEYSENINKVIFLNTINPQSTAYWFDWLKNLSSIENIYNLDTSNVTSMECMFGECSNLSNLDLNGFDTSNVTNMANMFNRCSELKSLDFSRFDTSNVTDMNGMFCECSKLKNLDLSSFDTSNVTDMSGMFFMCDDLTNLNVSSFDTRNVTNMWGMFECYSLTSLDVSNFNTSKVTDMGRMFSAMNEIITLNLSNFDTSNVTNMEEMFSNLGKIKTLNLSNFNTSKVKSMHGMFRNSKTIESLDLSSFDTSSCTDMSLMFYEADSIEILDLSSFDTSNCTSTKSMFFCNYPNSNLKTIYASNKFTTDSITSSESMFANCYKLVGGNGTAYIANHSYWDKTYARIDTASTPGYFTLKTN